MSFTYTAGASQKDDIRLLTKDTDPTAQLGQRLEDEDIDRLLELYSYSYAAAAAAETLAAAFARLPEGSSGGPGPSRTRAQELFALAGRLRARAAAEAAPSAGGIRFSQKEAARADPDLVPPSFRRGMLDHPGGG